MSKEAQSAPLYAANITNVLPFHVCFSIYAVAVDFFDCLVVEGCSEASYV
jgi:hypothetical protein